jgi:hypothetical protein
MGNGPHAKLTRKLFFARPKIKPLSKRLIGAWSGLLGCGHGELFSRSCSEASSLISTIDAQKSPLEWE